MQKTHGIFQYMASVFPCCQHTLYSAVLFGSIVRLGVIMLYIQHPTHTQSGLLTSHSAPQVPSALSHPYWHSFCFVFVPFFFFPGWLHPSLLNSFFSPSIYLILKTARQVYFLFLLYFLTLVFLFSEGEVQYSRYEARDPHVSRVQHPGTQRTSAVQTCPWQAWCRPR